MSSQNQSQTGYFEDEFDGQVYGIEVSLTTQGYSVWQDGQEVTFKIPFGHQDLVRKAVQGWLEAEKHAGEQALYEEAYNL